jgi:hypothetical protein
MGVLGCVSVVGVRFVWGWVVGVWMIWMHSSRAVCMYTVCVLCVYFVCVCVCECVCVCVGHPQGTLVCNGHGKAVVVGTGKRTEFGKTFEEMRDMEHRRTPLQVCVCVCVCGRCASDHSQAPPRLTRMVPCVRHCVITIP